MNRNESAFDFSAEIYDAFMGWEERLTRELPFLISHMERAAAHRVLDVACGTGRHAVALAQRGFKVEGVDASPRMLEQARRRAALADLDIPFHQKDMRRVHRLHLERADALICLGNAIPQLTTRRELRSALHSFRQSLRPGGLLLLHQRNWHRVWDLRERWMPVKSAVVDGREWIMLRSYIFQPQRVLTFQATWLERVPDGWRAHHHEVGMRAWFREDLDEVADGLFQPQAVYGSFTGDELKPLESPDLIWVGRAV